jgi:raffinose synthase
MTMPTLSPDHVSPAAPARALVLEPLRQQLRLGQRLLMQLAPGWSAVQDARGAGIFLRMEAAAAASYVEQALGDIVGLQRTTSVYRFSPFWTRPAAGRTLSELRPETLWLLAETSAGDYVLIVPLLDQATRFSLRGCTDGLAVVAETGDAGIATQGGVAVFVGHGDDPYALVAASARAVQGLLGTGRLRADKALPDTIDLFGWCTWDAFYKDVSADKVETGLQSFADIGVAPRLLILDDGWQSWERAASGEERLTSLAPNARFGGDLTALVRLAKSRYGVQRFLVWHALLGYWGGLSEAAFARYAPRSVARSFGPGLLEQEARWNVWPWGAQIGVPGSEQFAQFYDDLHASLQRQGVDGVKVDAQALLEGVSAGQGGRVATARASRRALEASVRKHFAGRLINCMACTSETAYLAADSTLLRSSDDFFPQRPDSHGLHVQVNAMAGVWFGEFMQPDWDMFHSLHPRAAFHAAARAISGGPVTVSDAPGAHDAALLRKLVLSDGTVLRADLPGRPSPDCLFADPLTQPVLLKIFNLNRDCGVLGLFHVNHAPVPISATVATCDVPGLDPARAYVAWSHRADRLWRIDGPAAFVLAEGEWELLSLAPLEQGFAVLGLADKFNSTGAIMARVWHEGQCQISLRDGGAFLAWAEHTPCTMSCDGAALDFVHDPATGRLRASVPTGGQRTLVVAWH